MSNTELLNSAATIGHNSAPIVLPKLTEAEKETIDKAMKALNDDLGKFVNDELDAVFVGLDAAKKDVQSAPFKVLKWLRQNVPAEKAALFPKPGSKLGESERPDQYEEAYFRDGKKKFRKAWFYAKFYLQNIPEGKKIAAALAHIAIAKDEKANHAAVPENIRNMNPVDLEAYREDLVSQQTTGTKALRDAVGLIQQLVAINKLPTVSADVLVDKDGNVRRTNKPIKVWNSENPENEWYLYTISGFMQFDPAAALEKGGNIEALKLTAKREQEEDDNDPSTADAPVAINTNKTFAARLGDIHEFISNKLMGDPKRELQLQFIKDHISAAGSDDLIESLDDIRAWASHILNIPAVQTRLEQIAQKKAA